MIGYGNAYLINAAFASVMPILRISSHLTVLYDSLFSSIQVCKSALYMLQANDILPIDWKSSSLLRTRL